MLATALGVVALVALFACADPPDEQGGAAGSPSRDEVRALIEQDKRAFALPADQVARTTYALEALAALSSPAAESAPAHRARRALEQTWVTSAAADEVDTLRRSLQGAVDDPGFSGYADYALEVRAWEQLSGDGDRARARFTAVPSYLRNPNAVVTGPDGWVDDHEQHFDVELRYDDGWKLAAVATRRSDGTTGP